MEMMMATIEDFIGHAVDKDYAKAGDVFNTLMADKLQGALDQEKIKVGGEIYNGIDPADLEIDPEEQLELDLDDDSDEASDDDEDYEEEDHYEEDDYEEEDQEENA